MKAVGKNVIVKMEKQEDTTTGGIIYKDQSLVTLAQVVAIGEDVNSVAVGDNLVINWRAANQVKLRDAEYHIVHLDHVYAIV